MYRRCFFRCLVASLTLLAFSAAPLGANQAAKNVILLISDGAGFNAFHAASYYEHGQLGRQPYDRFPVHLGCTTYMLNYVDAEGRVLPPKTIKASQDVRAQGAAAAWPQGYDPAAAWRDFNYVKGEDNYTAFTDSAAAATAIYTGRKTTDGRMGMNWDASQQLTTIADVAAALGKASGVVTSVQISHATPGAFWSGVAHRDLYEQIARRMIYDSPLRVVVGAGHPWFSDDGVLDYGIGQPRPQRDGYRYVGGADTWAELVEGKTGWRLVESKNDFELLARDQLPGGRPERLLGVAPAHRTLQFNRSGKAPAPEAPKNAGVPTLAVMTQAALTVLAAQEEGFVLMIEGGAVDWANHSQNLPRMLEEQVEFNEAAAAVVAWVEEHSSWDETLVIVTSDHECGMLWGPKAYADENGNGVFDAGVDTFLDWAPIENRGQGQVPGHSYGSRGHTNALVPLWAKGPGSDLFLERVRGLDRRAGEFWGFSGRYVDNTDIFMVMRWALEAAEAQPLPPAPPSPEN